MEERKPITITKDIEGLKCDNPACDWTDPSVKFENMEEHLNRECPKCGQNVLTEEDFHLAKSVKDGVDLINSLSPEMLESLGLAFEGGHKITATISMHKNLSIEVDSSVNPE